MDDPWKQNLCVFSNRYFVVGKQEKEKSIFFHSSRCALKNKNCIHSPLVFFTSDSITGKFPRKTTFSYLRIFDLDCKLSSGWFFCNNYNTCRKILQFVGICEWKKIPLKFWAFWYCKCICLSLESASCLVLSNGLAKYVLRHKPLETRTNWLFQFVPEKLGCFKNSEDIF